MAEIVRAVGVCRDNVYKYLREQDLSPKMPVARPRKSKLDPYRPLIESWLDEDRECWRKQRHTAKRIWERLTAEEHVEVSQARVRQYVAMVRRERGIGYDRQYLDLEWAPGIAQADFGEADFYVAGVRTRLSFFVLSFPFSNVGVAQVFASENATESAPPPLATCGSLSAGMFESAASASPAAAAAAQTATCPTKRLTVSSS